VYAVGHSDLSDHGRFRAALLAIGRDAVLSHCPAGALWGFWNWDRSAVDVTVPRRLRSRAGIRLHAVRALVARDSTHRSGIAVTTPARTLLDLADVVTSDRALRRAVHEAEVQRVVTHRQLRAQLRRADGRRGARRLAAIVATGPAPTRSELEDVTLELLRRHGFPRPQTNVRVRTVGQRAEVDFLFADLDLVIEADSARYHDTKPRREADARKQALLESAGYGVIRLDWLQVTHEEQHTVCRLRRVFAQQAALRAAGGAASG
jgi:very-short-patch-repair endonuclease